MRCSLGLSQSWPLVSTHQRQQHPLYLPSWSQHYTSLASLGHLYQDHLDSSLCAQAANKRQTDQHFNQAWVFYTWLQEGLVFNTKRDILEPEELQLPNQTSGRRGRAAEEGHTSMTEQLWACDVDLTSKASNVRHSAEQTWAARPESQVWNINMDNKQHSRGWSTAGGQRLTIWTMDKEEKAWRTGNSTPVSNIPEVLLKPMGGTLRRQRLIGHQHGNRTNNSCGHFTASCINK